MGQRFGDVCERTVIAGLYLLWWHIVSPLGITLGYAIDIYVDIVRCDKIEVCSEASHLRIFERGNL